MTIGRRAPLLAAAAAVALAGVVALRSRGPSGILPGPAADPASPARESASRFLDAYMDADGRVVRRDQGSDTVSEGQAYAMLLAAAIGDRTRFDRAWGWAKANLQRPDGLLSWLWRNEEVEDREAASDADVDAARALLAAAVKFSEPGYRDEALRIAAGILQSETVTAGGEPVLLAGPWARQGRLMVNPSYSSPRAFAELAAATGRPEWAALAASGRRIVDELTRQPPHLPPDWAVLGPSGEVKAVAAPGSSRTAPTYGYDAVRTLVRMAEDCDPAGQHLAARAWPFLERESESRIAPVYRLDGRPAAEDEHPAALAAAAAAARAAGDRRAADDLLDRAEEVDREAPGYYGAAWVALGRVILTTDLLGGCPG